MTNNVVNVTPLGAALYLAPTSETEFARVSETSRWSDPVWNFGRSTAGRKPAVIGWDAKLHDGSSLLEPQWGHLLDLGRRLVWSIRMDSQRGKNPKDSALPALQTRVRYLLAWMARFNYESFAEIDQEAARQFGAHALSDGLASGDSDDVKQHNLFVYLDLLCRIYEQSPLFVGHVEAIMREHPFAGRTAHEVAIDLVASRTGAIPPVPDAVLIPTLTAALDWLEAPARDLVRFSHAYHKVNSELGRRSNSYSWHLNKLLKTFRFDDGGALARPWRPQLDDIVEGGADTADRRRWTPIQQFRRLLEDVRDACTITLQGLLGLRISEVAGLQAEPSDAKSGWPACVEVRPSLSGLNEIFYVKGRLFKQRDQWDPVEWVAGSRPEGTDYVPPPIRALIVLHQMYAPWREQAASNDLIVSFGRHQGLPGPEERPSFIMSDDLRDGQKGFLRRHVSLPESHADWNLTTHQWRKSFALFMVRSDERLLPAVSDHFKHMSLAMTEQGYLGNDVELLGLMDDVATSEAARLLFEAVNGKTAVAGRMADVITDNAPTIRTLIGEDGTDEEKIERLTGTLKDDDVRVWPAAWGKCLFRSETARCHHQAKGEFDLAARRPHYATRQPATCCDCSNLLVAEVHAPFWQERHAENLELLRANREAGEDVAVAVAKERIRTSESILRRMGMISDLNEGGVA